VIEHRHRHDPVALGQIHATHALGAARAEHPHAADREAHALAAARRQQDIAAPGRDRDAYQMIALVQPHRDLAVGRHEDEIGKRVAAHLAACGGEHHAQLVIGGLVLRQRQHGGDGLAFGQLREQVDHRLAACLRRALRQAVDFQLVNPARRREEQHRRVGVGDEQLRQEIVLVGRHADPALAAAALLAIGRERRALDVAEPGHGDDHVLLLDQVLDVDLVVEVFDRGPARRGEALPDAQQLLLKDLEQPLARAQDVQKLADPVADLLQLVGDLGALELGQTVQAQLQDRLGLALREAVGIVRPGRSAR
jgi:hypothetical protein